MPKRQPRRSRDETRMLLLKKAREVMLEEGLPEGTNIKLSSVLERAGLTTGAAYQVWKSQQVFQEDLALYIAREFEWAQPNGDRDALRSMVTDNPSLEVATRRAALYYYDAFVNRPEFLMVLHFWGVNSPRPELSEAILEGYQIVHDGLQAMCVGTLETYGLKMRDPFNVTHLTVALSAATEGLILRQHWDKDNVAMEADTAHPGEELYVGMLQAIVGHFTEAA